MSAPDLEYVSLRTPEGLTVYLRHSSSNWMFRIFPFRDPDQPRLWCLRVEACAGPSMTAKTARIDPFYTSLAMTREQVGDTLRQIQASAPDWLDGGPQRDLCRWLDRVIATPLPAEFLPAESPGRSVRGGAPPPPDRHSTAPPPDLEP